MSVSNKQLIFYTLIGALIGLLTGVFLFTSPTCHTMLLAIMYFIGGEAALIIWGVTKVNRVKDKEYNNRILRNVFLIGIFAVLMAILILLFKSYFQKYPIQLTTVGLVLGLILQWTIISELYKVTKKHTTLGLFIFTVILLVLAVLFLIVSLFSSGISPIALGILDFCYVIIVLYTVRSHAHVMDELIIC